MKYQKTSKRVLSLLCAITMLISMCSMFALAAGNPAYGNIDIDREKVYDTDLSVMSLNVLGAEGSGYFDSAENRLQASLTIVETYQPDVITAQEISETANAFTDGSSWYDKMIPAMTALGYSYRALKNDISVTMNVTDGLVIFYKTDRFTKGTSFAEKLPATVMASYTHVDTADETKSNTYNYSHTSSDRYYQYVQLVDKEHNNQPVYVFNAHLAIEPTTAKNIDTNKNEDISNLRYQNSDGTYTTIPIKSILARKERTVQIKQMKAKMDTFAGSYPVIAGGDFNSTFGQGYANNAKTVLRDESEQGVLHLFDNDLKNGTDTYYDTARMALHQVSTSYAGIVDHIFVNNVFFDIADFRTISESVAGRRPTDHFPIMTQVSYRAATTAFGPGDYDVSNGVYEDKVDVSEYTFDVATVSPFTVKIEQNGVVCGNTVTLNKTINKFDINFYIGETLYDTIPATIHYTGADKPILQVENAVNHYFSNNAYHVVVENEISDITIRPVNGKIYTDAACTKAAGVHFNNIANGRTQYYMGNTVTGDVYPLYIYKETKPALNDEMVLYVDDDFGTAVGTVAFWDGVDVSLVTANVNAFDALDDINRPANGSEIDIDEKNNYIVYVAPGTYEPITDNNEYYVNSDVYNRSLTLLGPNHNIEANLRDMDGTWKINPNRRPEAVIHGMLRYAANDDYNDMGAFKVTVKGFTFEGKTPNASINVGEVRGTVTGSGEAAEIAKTEERTQYITEFDIQNNIFTASGYAFNSSAISANTASQKTGIIANNYFKNVAARIVDERAPNETQYEGNDYFRSIFMRNPNGLIIDGNRFVDIHAPIWLSSEIRDLYNSTCGNLTYTMQDNRFENCGSSYLWATALATGVENNSAIVKYYNNDFVRCGTSVGGPAIALNITEHASSTDAEGNPITVPTDYSKIDIDIQGNNFYDCYQSIRVYRSACERDTDNYADFINHEHLGDVNDMTLKITENRFINPTETSTKLTSLADTIQFNFYLNAEDALESTDEERELSDDAKARWDLSHNYFESKYIVEGADGATKDVQNSTTLASATSAHDPKYFVDNSIARYDSTGANLENGGVSFKWDGAFAPYYLDYELNTLSDGTNAATMSGITAENYLAEYDGQPHGITVTGAPAGSIVSYSIDNVEAERAKKAYTAHCPTYTDVCGPITVYYKVEKTGMVTVYGQATIQITPNTQGRTGLVDTTVTYELGKEQTLTPFVDPLTEDHYVYTYDGKTYDEMPAFTEVGRYEVGVIVTNANYATFVDSAVLTIEKADLDPEITGFTGVYDGEEHTITHDLPTDVRISYSIDDGEWTTTTPVFKDITNGDVTVKMKMEGSNYNPHEETVVFNISPATITDVSVTAVNGVENGTVQDLLTVVSGAAGTTVSYAVNGGKMSSTKPTFLKPGTYTVAVLFTRANHYDKTIVCNVTVEKFDPTSLFALEINQALIQNQNFKENFQTGGNQWRETILNKLNNNKFSLSFFLTLDYADAGVAAIQSEDFKILSFGILYGPTLENLEDYAFYQKHAFVYDGEKQTDAAATAAASAKALIDDSMVVQYVYDSDVTGLQNLYKFNTYHVLNTAPLKARYGMMYVRYSVNGLIYEEYSDIAATSTLLGDTSNTDPGYITGVGTQDETTKLDAVMVH